MDGRLNFLFWNIVHAGLAPDIVTVQHRMSVEDIWEARLYLQAVSELTVAASPPEK